MALVACGGAKVIDGPGGGAGTSGGGVGGASSGGAGGGATGTGVPIGELGEAVAQAFCAQIKNCSAGGDSMFRAFLTKAKRSCEEILAQLVFADTNIAQLQAGVRNGTITYDPKLARECLVALSQSCGDFEGDTVAACDLAFQGTLPAGTPCYLSEQCAGGGYCAFGLGACPGVCTPAQVALGGRCASSDECLKPAPERVVSCESTGLDASCMEVLAGDLADESQPCGRKVDRATNTVTVQPCKNGLYCDARDGELGVCRKPAAAGAQCSRDTPCVDGHVCVPESFGTCQKFQVVTAVGAPCHDLAPCSPFDGLLCSDGTCLQVSDGSRGAICGLEDSAIPCNGGLVCDRISGLCAEPKALGAPCQAGSECASRTCDSSSKRCAPPDKVCF